MDRNVKNINRITHQLDNEVKEQINNAKNAAKHKLQNRQVSTKLQQRNSKIHVGNPMSTILEENVKIKKFNNKKIKELLNETESSITKSNISVASYSDHTSYDVDSITFCSSHKASKLNCSTSSIDIESIKARRRRKHRMRSDSISEISKRSRSNNDIYNQNFSVYPVKLDIPKTFRDYVMRKTSSKGLGLHLSNSGLEKVETDYSKVSDRTSMGSIRVRKPSILSCILSDIFKDDKLSSVGSKKEIIESKPTLTRIVESPEVEKKDVAQKKKNHKKTRVDVDIKHDEKRKRRKSIEKRKKDDKVKPKKTERHVSKKGEVSKSLKREVLADEKILKNERNKRKTKDEKCVSFDKIKESQDLIGMKRSTPTLDKVSIKDNLIGGKEVRRISYTKKILDQDEKFAKRYGKLKPTITRTELGALEIPPFHGNKKDKKNKDKHKTEINENESVCSKTCSNNINRSVNQYPSFIYADVLHNGNFIDDQKYSIESIQMIMERANGSSTKSLFGSYDDVQRRISKSSIFGNFPPSSWISSYDSYQSKDYIPRSESLADISNRSLMLISELGQDLLFRNDDYNDITSYKLQHFLGSSSDCFQSRYNSKMSIQSRGINTDITCSKAGIRLFSPRYKSKKTKIPKAFKESRCTFKTKISRSNMDKKMSKIPIYINNSSTSTKKKKNEGTDVSIVTTNTSLSKPTKKSRIPMVRSMLKKPKHIKTETIASTEKIKLIDSDDDFMNQIDMSDHIMNLDDEMIDLMGSDDNVDVKKKWPKSNWLTSLFSKDDNSAALYVLNVSEETNAMAQRSGVVKQSLSSLSVLSIKENEISMEIALPKKPRMKSRLPLPINSSRGPTRMGRYSFPIEISLNSLQQSQIHSVTGSNQIANRFDNHGKELTYPIWFNLQLQWLNNVWSNLRTKTPQKRIYEITDHINVLTIFPKTKKVNNFWEVTTQTIIYASIDQPKPEPPPQLEEIEDVNDDVIYTPITKTTMGMSYFTFKSILRKYVEDSEYLKMLTPCLKGRLQKAPKYELDSTTAPVLQIVPSRQCSVEVIEVIEESDEDVDSNDEALPKAAKDQKEEFLFNPDQKEFKSVLKKLNYIFEVITQDTPTPSEQSCKCPDPCTCSELNMMHGIDNVLITQDKTNYTIEVDDRDGIVCDCITCKGRRRRCDCTVADVIDQLYDNLRADKPFVRMMCEVMKQHRQGTLGTILLENRETTDEFVNDILGCVIEGNKLDAKKVNRLEQKYRLLCIDAMHPLEISDYKPMFELDPVEKICRPCKRCVCGYKKPERHNCACSTDEPVKKPCKTLKFNDMTKAEPIFAHMKTETIINLETERGYHKMDIFPQITTNYNLTEEESTKSPPLLWTLTKRLFKRGSNSSTTSATNKRSRSEQPAKCKECDSVKRTASDASMGCSKFYDTTDYAKKGDDKKKKKKDVGKEEETEKKPETLHDLFIRRMKGNEKKDYFEDKQQQQTTDEKPPCELCYEEKKRLLAKNKKDDVVSEKKKDDGAADKKKGDDSAADKKKGDDGAADKKKGDDGAADKKKGDDVAAEKKKDDVVCDGVFVRKRKAKKKDDEVVVEKNKMGDSHEKRKIWDDVFIRNKYDDNSEKKKDGEEKKRLWDGICMKTKNDDDDIGKKEADGEKKKIWDGVFVKKKKKKMDDSEKSKNDSVEEKKCVVCEEIKKDDVSEENKKDDHYDEKKEEAHKEINEDDAFEKKKKKDDSHTEKKKRDNIKNKETGDANEENSKVGCIEKKKKKKKNEGIKTEKEDPVEEKKVEEEKVEEKKVVVVDIDEEKNIADNKKKNECVPTCPKIDCSLIVNKNRLQVNTLAMQLTDDNTKSFDEEGGDISKSRCRSCCKDGFMNHNALDGKSLTGISLGRRSERKMDSRVSFSVFGGIQDSEDILLGDSKRKRNKRRKSSENSTKSNLKKDSPVLPLAASAEEIIQNEDKISKINFNTGSGTKIDESQDSSKISLKTKTDIEDETESKYPLNSISSRDDIVAVVIETDSKMLLVADKKKKISGKEKNLSFDKKDTDKIKLVCSGTQYSTQECTKSSKKKTKIVKVLKDQFTNTSMKNDKKLKTKSKKSNVINDLIANVEAQPKEYEIKKIDNLYGIAPSNSDVIGKLIERMVKIQQTKPDDQTCLNPICKNKSNKIRNWVKKEMNRILHVKYDKTNSDNDSKPKSSKIFIIDKKPKVKKKKSSIYDIYKNNKLQSCESNMDDEQITLDTMEKMSSSTGNLKKNMGTIFYHKKGSKWSDYDTPQVNYVTILNSNLNPKDDVMVLSMPMKKCRGIHNMQSKRKGWQKVVPEKFIRLINYETKFKNKEVEINMESTKREPLLNIAVNDLFHNKKEILGQLSGYEKLLQFVDQKSFKHSKKDKEAIKGIIKDFIIADASSHNRFVKNQEKKLIPSKSDIDMLRGILKQKSDDDDVIKLIHYLDESDEKLENDKINKRNKAEEEELRSLLKVLEKSKIDHHRNKRKYPDDDGRRYKKNRIEIENYNIKKEDDLRKDFSVKKEGHRRKLDSSNKEDRKRSGSSNRRSDSSKKEENRRKSSSKEKKKHTDDNIRFNKKVQTAKTVNFSKTEKLKKHNDLTYDKSEYVRRLLKLIDEQNDIDQAKSKQNTIDNSEDIKRLIKIIDEKDVFTEKHQNRNNKAGWSVVLINNENNKNKLASNIQFLDQAINTNSEEFEQLLNSDEFNEEESIIPTKGWNVYVVDNEKNVINQKKIVSNITLEEDLVEEERFLSTILENTECESGNAKQKLNSGIKEIMQLYNTYCDVNNCKHFKKPLDSNPLEILIDPETGNNSKNLTTTDANKSKLKNPIKLPKVNKILSQIGRICKKMVSKTNCEKQEVDHYYNIKSRRCNTSKDLINYLCRDKKKTKSKSECNRFSQRTINSDIPSLKSYESKCVSERNCFSTKKNEELENLESYIRRRSKADSDDDSETCAADILTKILSDVYSKSIDNTSVRQIIANASNPDGEENYEHFKKLLEQEIRSESDYRLSESADTCGVYIERKCSGCLVKKHELNKRNKNKTNLESHKFKQTNVYQQNDLNLEPSMRTCCTNTNPYYQDDSTLESSGVSDHVIIGDTVMLINDRYQKKNKYTKNVYERFESTQYQKPLTYERSTTYGKTNGIFSTNQKPIKYPSTYEIQPINKLSFQNKIEYERSISNKKQSMIYLKPSYASTHSNRFTEEHTTFAYRDAIKTQNNAKHNYIYINNSQRSMYLEESNSKARESNNNSRYVLEKHSRYYFDHSKSDLEFFDEISNFGREVGRDDVLAGMGTYNNCRGNTNCRYSVVPMESKPY